MCSPWIVGGFRGGPFDGEPCSHPGLVFVLLDQTGQTEVGNLDNVIFTHQHVTGSKIPKIEAFSKTPLFKHKTLYRQNIACWLLYRIPKSTYFLLRTCEYSFETLDRPYQLPLELTYPPAAAALTAFLYLIKSNFSLQLALTIKRLLKVSLIDFIGTK